ncbi:hypothetical protein MRX96_053983 [Rhipicephalus microplus]
MIHFCSSLLTKRTARSRSYTRCSSLRLLPRLCRRLVRGELGHRRRRSAGRCGRSVDCGVDRCQRRGDHGGILHEAPDDRRKERRPEAVVGGVVGEVVGEVKSHGGPSQVWCFDILTEYIHGVAQRTLTDCKYTDALYDSATEAYVADSRKQLAAMNHGAA